jgi:NADH-quinone oxidoreductase subunit L
MLLLILLLPFGGFLVNTSVGRRLPKAVTGGVACLAMVAAFLVAVMASLSANAAATHAVQQTVFRWIPSGDFQIPFALRVDPLATVMILVVTGVSSLIHIYSTSYMKDETDSEYARYFSYLNLFAAFMLVLVLGANLLVLFVGWEGVGLCSYLLVGFWYQKQSASDAGKKAFIVNRIGDFAFILGILLTFVRFGSIDFQTVAQSAAALSPETTFGTVSLITLLLFIGATGKSAQIPLYVWLPDAMEGPTPVSALIHAATMVTAGVYMIGRNAVLFSHAPQTLTIVAIVGAATALMAGTIALVQNDIKRVLAYSTVSQLGYMFLAMGVGAFSAGIFHLYTHAFFKALLFLGSGAVIHALAGEQDMRRMGGLRKELPITYWTFLIASLAISGVPLLSGFFSKDEILYRTYASGHTILWVVGLFTSLLTAIYMFRVVFLTFHGDRAPEPVAPEHPEEEEPAAHHGHLHDAPPAMALALIVLAIGAVFAGYAGFPSSLGGSDRFARYLEPSFTVEEARLKPDATNANVALPDSRDTNAALPDSRSVRLQPDHTGAESAHGLELGLMAVSSLAALAGIGLAFFFFLTRKSAARALAERFSGLHRLLLNKYYVDEAYDAAIVQPIRIVSEEGLWKIIDVQVIDGAVNGVGDAVGGGSELLRRLQTGSVRAYAASLLFGVVALLGYYLWR